MGARSAILQELEMLSRQVLDRGIDLVERPILSVAGVTGEGAGA